MIRRHFLQKEMFDSKNIYSVSMNTHFKIKEAIFDETL